MNIMRVSVSNGSCLLVLCVLFATAVSRQCREGWRSNNALGACYKVSDKKKDWYSAGEHCIAEGASLARITSEEEDTFLNTFLEQNSISEVWINAMSLGGRWLDHPWKNDYTFDNRHTRRTHKFGFKKQDNKHGWHWKDSVHTDEKLFLCKGCPVIEQCSSDSNICYTIGCHSEPYFIATEKCSKQNGILAEPKTKKEYESLSEFIRNVFNEIPSVKLQFLSKGVFVGGQRDSGDENDEFNESDKGDESSKDKKSDVGDKSRESVFYWVMANQTIQKESVVWEKDEPDNKGPIGTDENCLAIDPAGKLNDVVCWEDMPYVCEKKMNFSITVEDVVNFIENLANQNNINK